MLPSTFFSLPAQIEVLAAGEVLRRRNQTLTSVLHLESGRVLRGVYEAGRMRHQLGVVEGPFWLDAASAMLEKPFPVDMVAETRVQVRRLPIEEFRRGCASLPPVAQGLLRDMATGYRAQSELAVSRLGVQFKFVVPMYYDHNTRLRRVADRFPSLPSYFLER